MRMALYLLRDKRNATQTRMFSIWSRKARPSATILAPSEATRGVVVILDHQDDHARWEAGTKRRRRVVRGIEALADLPWTPLSAER
jgi:hypothetical protein